VHPILFHIGNFPVRAYGTLILIGFFVALRYAMAEARRLPQGDAPDGKGRVTPDHVFDMALFGLVAGLIGTRVVFVALNWKLFAGDPIEALKIWTGGLSFIGAPIFGFGYVWLYCRRHRLPFLVVADIGAPGFALAYAFGRIGCFLNGCCYGRECSLPWAARFHEEGAVGVLTEPSHPTQIYAAIMSLAVFGALHALRRMRRPVASRSGLENPRSYADGTVVVSYFLLYATYRFVNDWFRAGATSKVLLWGLTDGQLTSLVAAPILIGLLWRLSRRRAPATP